MKLFVAACAMAALVLFRAPAALAQSDAGEIVITVVDSVSKAPIGLARVLLDGPVITAQYTGPDGKVAFKDAPVGIYRARVTKSGYQPVTSAEFELLDGKSVSVDVALGKRPDVRTLATVIVTSTATISTSSISDASATRKLSETLTDALNKLSGVTLSTNPAGDDAAAVTVSLNGQDASQTALTLDGVPLNAPGAAGDLRQVNTDLFSGASASLGPTAGALAGGVNFRTLDPTLSWQGRFTTSLGSHDKSSTILSEQGTIDGLGLVYVHSIRGGLSPLAGTRYLDSSGLDYIHQGASQSGGDLIKIRHRLGADQTLTASFTSSTNYSDALCTTFAGPVPCGYGPGNVNARRFSMASLSDAALVGSTSVQFSLYGTDSNFNRDLLARFLAGVPDPFGTDTRRRTRGASLSLQFPSRERHEFALQAISSASSFDSIALVPSAVRFGTASQRTSYTSVSLSDNIRSSPTLTLTDRLGVTTASPGFVSLIGGVGADWKPTSSDSITANVDLGNKGAPPPRVETLSDPASLRFNCASSQAFGDAPGDQAGPLNSTSARVSWQHRLRFGQLNASVYRQVQDDSLLSVLVRGDYLAPALLPAGYLAQAQAIFASAAGCGSTAQFGLPNLYFSQPVSGVRRVYEGVSLAGGFQLGPNLVVAPYFDIQSASPYSTDPRVTNPASTTISGSQLPNVPLHKAGISLDYKARRSAVETLFDAQYVGRNNGLDLPAYVTADAGAAVRLDNGTLTVAVTNLFNAHGEDFSTPGGVPLPTVGGIAYPTLQHPLSPRQFSVTYSVKLGFASPARPAAGASDAGGSGRAGAAANRGEVLSALTALPAQVPNDPLALSPSAPPCTPAFASTASPALAALRTYVAAVEATKITAGYPASAPTGAPSVPGFDVAYRAVGPSYALTLTPVTFAAFRPLFSCATIHAGTLEDAQARALFVPPANPFFRLPINYAPSVGLYVVRRPPQAGAAQFRLYRLPATAPVAPYATRASALCPPDQFATATQLMNALQQWIAAYDPAKPLPAKAKGWSVTPHVVAGTYWLELQADDVSTVQSVLDCGHVGAATSGDVKAKGIDGVRPPELNYTPAFGLYLMQPKP